MNYKQGLRLVAAAASYGLDMQSQVHIMLGNTTANHYPHVEMELPPHIAIWVDFETYRDFHEATMRKWNDMPLQNTSLRIPESVTGDEYICFFYLED